MILKKGVKIKGITPEMVVAMLIIDSLDRRRLRGTSVTEGRHGWGSLHFVGYGLDVGIRRLTYNQAIDYRNEIKSALTDEFDVILEWNKKHIHVEFQPKI